MKRNPKGGFSTPLTTLQAIFGFFLLAIHIFALPPLLRWLNAAAGWTLGSAQLDLIYYAVSFALCVAFLFQFLRLSFRAFFDGFGATLTAIILSFVAYYAMLYLVSLLQNLISGNFALPAIGGTAKLNHSALTVITLLLAPVVEECLFRGVAFGCLRRKSRIAAYIVSLLLFSLYQIFWTAIGSLSWSLLWTALYYLPASLALCWCYERSGSVWASIVLHILINCVSLIITIG